MTYRDSLWMFYPYGYVLRSVSFQTLVTVAYTGCYIRAKSVSGFFLRLFAKATLPPPFSYRNSMPTLTIPASIPKRKAACVSCRQRKKKCDVRNPIPLKKLLLTY
jgi:hypothetical protein